MSRSFWFFGLLAGLALVGCGGSSASINNGQLTFVSPSFGTVPVGASFIQYSVIDAAGHTIRNGTTTIGGSNTVLSKLPIGAVVVDAYAEAYVNGTVLATGRWSGTVGLGGGSVAINYSPVPPPLMSQKYVLSGTVCTNPDDHKSGRISLHAVIDETTDQAQTGYIGTNFRVFEDGIELKPFTVGHANTVARAREDICFVLDSTAAEGNELQGVANSISTFANQLSTADQNVQFGGVEVGDNVRSTFPLNKSATAFESWVKGLTAHGGSGVASNQLDGINSALSFKWRMDSQHILIVVTSLPYYYAGDGSGLTNQTPELIAQSINSGFVVDSICPPTSGPILHSAGTAPPRHIQYISTLSNEVGGMSISLPSGGNVDLSQLNIPALIFAGYVFKIPSSLHVPPVDHVVRVLLQDNSGTPIADVNLPGNY